MKFGGVFLLTQLDEMIKKIEDGTSSKGIQYFLDVYTEYSFLWESVRWVVMNPENDILYRARRAEDKLFTNICELKYPQSH